MWLKYSHSKHFFQKKGGGTSLDSLSEGLETIYEIITQSKLKDVVNNTSPLAGEVEFVNTNSGEGLIQGLMRGRKGRFAPQDDMVLNGSSHFTPHSSLRKAAFTLAEVLITLGIIGIVAALTLPAMIQNYQKKVYVTKLKKAVVTVEHSVRMFMAEQNLETLSEDEWILYNKNINKYLKGAYTSTDSDFYKELAAIGAGGEDMPIYTLSDGSCLTAGNGTFIVDINCDKKPNLPGRDRFAFELKKNGFVNYPANITLSEINDTLGVFGVSGLDELPACAELGDKIISAMANSMCGDNEECKVSFSNQIKNDPMMSFEIGGIGMMACFSKVVSDGWAMKY